MCTSVRKWWNWLELVDLLLFSPRHPRCVGDKDNNNWQIAPLIYQSGRNRVLTNTPLNRAASYVIVQKASNTRCHRASGLFVRSGAFLRPLLHCQRKYLLVDKRGTEERAISPATSRCYLARYSAYQIRICGSRIVRAGMCVALEKRTRSSLVVDPPSRSLGSASGTSLYKTVGCQFCPIHLRTDRATESISSFLSRLKTWSIAAANSLQSCKKVWEDCVCECFKDQLTHCIGIRISGVKETGALVYIVGIRQVLSPANQRVIICGQNGAVI